MKMENKSDFAILQCNFFFAYHIFPFDSLMIWKSKFVVVDRQRIR